MAKPKRPVRKDEHNRAFDRAWFEGEAYGHEQPFETFVRKALREHEWVKNLRATVLTGLPDPRHPEKSIALEIGPGISPLLTLVPELKQVFFLEQSHELSRKLGEIPVTTARGTIPLSQWLENKMHRITGDVRRLPLSPSAKFDIIAISEVLTHVKPRERLRVLRELASRTNAMLIIDRQQISMEEIKKRKEQQGKKLPKEVLINIYRQKINGQQITEYFHRNNWDIFPRVYEVNDPEQGKIEYFIILAKRK